MPNSRALNGVINDFLGTYTSRYTDYCGYWLFGFLCRGNWQLQVDLLGDRRFLDRTPEEAASSLAVHLFVDQLRKVGMPASHVREARLTIRTPDQTVVQVAGGVLRRGYEMTFEVDLTSDQGKRFQARSTRFVAPHDPAVEERSAGSGT
jgi:hypothetical protein